MGRVLWACLRLPLAMLRGEWDAWRERRRWADADEKTGKEQH